MNFKENPYQQSQNSYDNALDHLGKSNEEIQRDKIKNRNKFAEDL